ncbi:MAG: MOSC domain-containing protein [Bacteroidota bacterium]
MIPRGAPGALTLSSLIYYPIKACRGVEADTAFVERMGLRDDRRMMVVTPQGRFLTQRQCPRLALVAPSLEGGSLTLSAPGLDSFSLPIRETGAPRPVDIWRTRGVPSIDQGDDVADWFSACLGAPVRLVRLMEGAVRRVSSEYAVNADDHTGFADGYPVLLASQASLGDLNERLETPVPMNRFRPNLVIGGCAPYAEDTWNRIRVGPVELAVVKPCARCVVTTIDKETLEQTKEPLKTLAAYRRHPLGAIFGQNAIPLSEGGLALGMPVEVLS